MPRINLTPFLLFFAATSVAAETAIHRCLLEDGTIAFQETPCVEPAADAADVSVTDENLGAGEKGTADDDVLDFVNPFDQPARNVSTAEPASLEPVSLNRAECEKTTRNAIDAIDLEMRGKTYTREQGQEYLAELLALTRQLRGCGAL